MILLLQGALLLALAFALLFAGCRALLKSIYPLKYGEQVAAAAEETGLSPALLYAVIKTESNFDPNARSHAGAVGLMQMIPETFQWIQRYVHGEELYGDETLSDPEVNIRYGSIVLQYLTEKYGDEKTALYAYNAGSGNVDKWLGDPRYSNDGKTLHTIPFGETRRYVERIETAQKIYRKLYGLEE